jgi:hypothetical protein
LAPLLAVALGAVARCARHPGLFAGGVLLPYGNDASYHARRILRLAQDFRYPALFDPLLDWPRGAATHWSPGFDAVAAAIAVLVGGGSDPQRAAWVAAVLPALYGVAAVAVVGALARRLAPDGDGLLWATAALFVALVPQSVTISQVGFVDHHVTEVLLTALLWRWTLASTELAERRAPLSSRLRFEAGGALLVAASVWVQSVGLLYVGVAAAALVALPLARRLGPPTFPRAWIGGGGPAFGAGALLLALAYAPAVREHGHPYAYEFPSWFQPLLLGFGALAVLSAGLVARWIGRGDLRASAVAIRLGASLAAVAGAAVLVFALVPAARGALWGLVDLARTRGPDLAKIDELQPLLGPPGARWDRVDAYFGWTGRAAIVLLPLGLVAARRAGRERFAGIVVFTAALLALSLSQNRWSRVLVVPLAILMALALRWIADRLLRSTTGGARASGAAAFLLGLALLLLPDPLRALVPEPDREVAVFEAGLFLRDLGRPVRAGARSGVLAPWNDAFPLLHTSGLPVLSTGHAWLVGEDGYRRERAAWSGNAEALWALMDDRDLGFVVAGADNLTTVRTGSGAVSLLRKAEGGGAAAQRIDWDYFRAVPLGVMVLGGTALPELGVPHLERLCPRSAGSEFAPLDVPVPRLWVFERVEGAILEGHARPGSRVVIELLLRHAAGIVSYFAFTETDRSGAFSIRFPVPTRMVTSTLQTGNRLHVRREASAVTDLELPEAAVLSGAHVAVPDAAPAP